MKYRSDHKLGNLIPLVSHQCPSINYHKTKFTLFVTEFELKIKDGEMLAEIPASEHWTKNGWFGRRERDG